MNETLSSIERLRDEVRLKAHLGSKELQDRLETAETELRSKQSVLEAKAEDELEKAYETVQDDLEKLRTRFERIRAELTN